MLCVFVLLLSFLSPCSGDTMAVTGFAQAAPAAEEAALDAAAGATPCPTTTTDENKALVQRYWKEVWHAGGTDVVGELLAPSEVHHWGLGTDTTGTAAFAERLKVFLAAFPDIQFTVNRVRAEGNTVVTGWTATATHQGPFAGVAATGRKVTWTGINIFQIDCGKITESWGEADHIGLRQQLGALPADATPTP